MSEFKSFDTLEQMQQFMREQHDFAMANMGAHQKALLGRRKFCWVRPYPQMDMFIFGEYDLDAWIENEERLAKAGGERFTQSERDHIEHNNLTRGYLSGTAYSPVEPRGEVGDTHVSQVYEITREAFEEARSVGWKVDTTTRVKAPRLYLELAAYAAAETPDLRELYRRPAEAGD